MSSNHSIIIDKGERHKYYVSHRFRDLLSGPQYILNIFIERTKDYWDKVAVVKTRELTHIAN